MRLTVESVDRASAAVKRPQYARTEVTSGIVHLGIGAFHRAHQAVVIALLSRFLSGWGSIPGYHALGDAFAGRGRIGLAGRCTLPAGEAPSGLGLFIVSATRSAGSTTPSLVGTAGPRSSGKIEA
jgi:hypothetical protein